MYTADIIQIIFLCIITSIFFLCFCKCLYEKINLNKLEKKYRLFSISNNINIEIQNNSQ
jgi:hypothetical protein